MEDGFITAAAVARADDGSWIQVSESPRVADRCCVRLGNGYLAQSFITAISQVTGCLDPAKSGLDLSDSGGQFDVRFPNGAQCTFGGYAASFIEQFVFALRLFTFASKIVSIAIPAASHAIQSRACREQVLPPLLLVPERPGQLQFASRPGRLRVRYPRHIRLPRPRRQLLVNVRRPLVWYWTLWRPPGPGAVYHTSGSIGQCRVRRH